MRTKQQCDALERVVKAKQKAEALQALKANRLLHLFKLHLAQHQYNATYQRALNVELPLNVPLYLDDLEITLHPGGTITIVDLSDVDTANRRTAIGDINELLAEHGLKLQALDNENKYAHVVHVERKRVLTLARVHDSGEIEIAEWRSLLSLVFEEGEYTMALRPSALELLGVRR